VVLEKAGISAENRPEQAQIADPSMRFDLAQFSR